jgi:PAS domain S-box-containing protein
MDAPTQSRSGPWVHYSAISRDIFVTVGFDGVFVEVAGDVPGVLGWTGEQLRERRFSHFLHPDDSGLRDDELARLLGGGVTVEFTNRYRTKQREWRWLEWRAIGVPEPELIYATARDITDRVELDMALEQLGVVTGFLELLERRYADRLDQDGMHFVSAALSGARRMQRLQG